MNIISFEPWKDDRWSQLQMYKILWVLTAVLLGFYTIAPSSASLSYFLMGLMSSIVYWVSSISTKDLGMGLGFGTKKNIVIAIAVGIGIGLAFTVPGLLSMKSLVTTQEATLIQQFFNNMGLRLSLDTTTFWVNVFYQVVSAGFIEEVFFRGFLVPTIIFLFKNARLGVLAGNGFFGLFHLYVYGANPYQVLFAIIFGVVVTIANYKVKSLVPGIIAHMMNNIAFGGFIR